MAHKLTEQKLQARDERILEGKKRKWESFQSRNSSGKSNHRENSRQTSQNNQKQGNARAMITAPINGNVSSGSHPLCERCFTRHVGPCTIKCHKCGKVGHKTRYCKEMNVATGANAQPIPTCYNCGEQGHTRNRCPRKVKQEETGEVRGRAYAIKDVEPQGPNVVTGTFMLNNRYALVLFNSDSDRSFVDTRFSSMLNIDPVKIGASYEVELADGRVVSTNTVLKGCTLNLVNHIFEIDLMPIELGTFNVIIGKDWLVKHDAVIFCGGILYGNKMLIVKSDKGVSRLKVFPEDLPGLPPPRQVEFRFDLKNEGMLCDQIAVLKSDASFNEAKIIALKSYINKLKKEKEDNLLKINNYDNATKSLDKVIGSQLVDNNKKGLGYNVVPPLLTGLFAPPTIDLSHSGIEKFKEPKFVGYGVKVDKIVSENSSVEIKKTTDAPIVKDWESDSDDEDDKPKPKVVKKTVDSKTVKQDVVSDGKLKKKTVFPTTAKIEVVKPKQQEKPVRKPVKYAEMYRSQKPRGNQKRLDIN
ncbi:putative reverse transcriptase domain-containing protein [Tanacetum coccineum]